MNFVIEKYTPNLKDEMGQVTVFGMLFFINFVIFYNLRVYYGLFSRKSNPM